MIESGRTSSTDVPSSAVSGRLGDDQHLAEVSERLRRRIEHDFPPGSAEEVVRILAELPPDLVGGQDGDRVLAAVVLSSKGQWRRFVDAVAMLKMGWRDALVSGGLANEDWREKLEVALARPTSRADVPI